MPWTSIVETSRQGQGLTIDGFRAYFNLRPFTSWRPSFMVLHNTGLPTLATLQANGEFDTYSWKGRTPAAQRILNLEKYYRDDQGWSAGPHAFVADDYIWPFTPMNMRGVHSPSWNGTALGIELVGDYEREDPYSGFGLKAYRNAVALFGIVHATLGLDPQTIKFHRQDPRTTHRCPGARLWRDGAGLQQFIQHVLEFMGQAGDHIPEDNPATDPGSVTTPSPREGVVIADDGLNIRMNSSASSQILSLAEKGQKVAVLREALNGTTLWYRVWYRDEQDNQHAGWASARYIQLV